MTRGKILWLKREEAVARALSQITCIPAPLKGAPAGAGGRPIAYRLASGFNGGSDPTAPHCASWSFGGNTPTADCIGFALWASGIDRMQPGYEGSRDEWLNCASLLDDADTERKFCRPLTNMVLNKERPQAGDWLLTEGHIGFIVRPETSWSVEGVTHKLPTLVVDCSPRHGFVESIQFGTAWSKDCRTIRPLIYAESKPA